MKYLTFKFAMLSLAIIALVGCSKEQSSLNIEDIPGKAKILGSFSFDAGQGYSNGKYIRLIKPAANVKVVVKVSNASLSPNGNAEGYTYYETTTSDNGTYEVEIPAVDDGTTIKIAPYPFFATYSKVVSVENNTPVFEKEERLYKIDEETRSVNPNDIQIFDAQYSEQERDIEEPYAYNSTFVVRVGEPIYLKNRDEQGVYVVERNYKEAATKNVIVKIDDYYYGATTNGDGEATFIIPSENKVWSTDVEIDVPGYVATKKFVYYEEEYDVNGDLVVSDYVIANGTYELNSGDAYKSVSFSGLRGFHLSALCGTCCH